MPLDWLGPWVPVRLVSVPDSLSSLLPGVSGVLRSQHDPVWRPAGAYPAQGAVEDAHQWQAHGAGLTDEQVAEMQLVRQPLRPDVPSGCLLSNSTSMVMLPQVAGVTVRCHAAACTILLGGSACCS